MAEGDSPEISSLSRTDLRGITGTKNGGTVEQRQERLQQLYQRAQQSPLGDLIHPSQLTNTEHQRTILTPNPSEAVHAQVTEEKKPSVESGLSIIPPNQIPQEAIDRTLAVVSLDYREELSKAIREGQAGEMLIEASSEGDHLKLEIVDPNNRSNRITWTPGVGGPEAKNALTLGQQTRLETELLTPPAATPTRREVLNRYLWQIEGVVAGDGLSEGDINVMFRRLIRDVTFGNPAETRALEDYFAARQGLDSVWRNWRGGAVLGNQEKTDSYWTGAGFSLTEAHLTTLIGRPAGGGAPAIPPAIPGIAQAFAEIQAVPVNMILGGIIQNGGYFANERANHVTARANMVAAGMTEQQAEITLTIAERILQATLVAERFGAPVLSSQSRPKSEAENLKIMQDSVSKLFSAISGGKVKF